MEHAATLDLQQFEDPDFYDRLERARRGTQNLQVLNQIISFGQDALTLISLGAALVAASPWLLVLLALAVIPCFLGETHFASLTYAMRFRLRRLGRDQAAGRLVAAARFRGSNRLAAVSARPRPVRGR